MSQMKMKLGAAFLTGAVAALVLLRALPNADAAAPAVDGAQLQRLVDREQILELLTAYGETLDRHDFAAFGQLFTEDATYVGGSGTTRGREAIQASLEKIIKANPLGLPGPKFHVFFNPSIQIDGDRAKVRALGAYITPDPEKNIAQMVFFVTYEDELVRRDGRWLFQQRVIHSGIPSPRK